METRHILKNANVSLRKVRTFLPGIKKMPPTEALVRLGFLPHSAARVLAGALKAAMTNAEFVLKVPKNMLEFRSLKADQGLVLKRFRAGSRGTALPISRRMTHITIVLGVKNDSTKISKPKVNETKVIVDEKEKVDVEKKEKTKSKSKNIKKTKKTVNSKENVESKS